MKNFIFIAAFICVLTPVSGYSTGTWQVVIDSFISKVPYKGGEVYCTRVDNLASLNKPFIPAKFFLPVRFSGDTCFIKTQESGSYAIFSVSKLFGIYNVEAGKRSTFKTPGNAIWATLKEYIHTPWNKGDELLKAILGLHCYHRLLTSEKHIISL